MEWVNLIFTLSDAIQDCQNGGSKTFYLKCSCPKLFTGNYCQHIKCLNGGVKRPNETCACPDAKHYTGRHCEIVMCENGGIANEFGSCNCSSGWYTGQFCEKNAVWWSLFYCIIFLIIVFVTFVFICWLRKFCCSNRNTQIANMTTGRQGNLECQLNGGQTEMAFLSRARRYKQQRRTNNGHRPEPPFIASHQRQFVEKPSSDYPEAPPPPYEAALFMKQYVCSPNE
ncbi:Neurogenic locus notch -like protein [Trichinella pseudospiralis]|uniref:Neurogenic locus notch-like protein n=2 Tax=Trichinella pseudospiralis TaxID=6337 RepID=A0A0V0YMU3_TRIPS|nr:Neurogenic locus notch -like protein [Trichinella pseudospiralis]KRY79465.1 Neurogenic locus notch -like protein [Trichinella pseudospiralis]KRY90837.1 Neurogenic locus notch -like protein [Trichinella pseudospiralis]KRZ31477.1 Neurogenic locus notch -like protein [Trichinella pseudospiralis]KRZ43121.1 Neurogenic locus notch -like protein [Trichinella pseudospiralis]